MHLVETDRVVKVIHLDSIDIMKIWSCMDAARAVYSGNEGRLLFEGIFLTMGPWFQTKVEKKKSLTVNLAES